MGVLLLVLGILAAVAVIMALVLVPLLWSWRKKSDAFDTELKDEMTANGEIPIIGPESAIYRGSSGVYGSVSGNGMIVLTTRRLLFRKRSGGVVEVPVDKITGTHEAKTFQGSVVGGKTHLVVSTDDPAEIGFFVDDLPRWRSGIGAACSP